MSRGQPWEDPEIRGAFKPQPPLRFKTAQMFCSEYVPLAYVAEPIIRTSSVYTATAKTGGGKTAFNIALSLAVTTGRKDIIGLDVEAGRVLYVAAENPDDVRMRLMTAAYLLNVDLSELDDRLVILDQRGKPEELVSQVAKLAEASETPFSLIIIDTLAAAFDGKDLNDNVETGEFVRRLRPLTQQIPGMPAVLIAAHPTKNAAEDNLVPYGGGAILNEVDGNLTLSKRADTGNTVLSWQGKFRGLEFQPIHFRFELVSSPDVIDNKGRQVQLPVLRPCSEEDVEDRARTEANVDLAILKALSAEPVPSTREMAAQVHKSRTAVEARLKRMSKNKLTEQQLGRWRLTVKGMKVVSDCA